MQHCAFRARREGGASSRPRRRKKNPQNHGDAFTRYQSNMSMTRILPTQCTPQPKHAANFVSKHAVAAI
jgi:hypothetical protein